MVPPDGRSLCVVNEKVVTAVVLFDEKRSWAAIIMLTLCTWPCTMARLVAPTLTRSADVLIFRPELLDATTVPVVNSPAANVILCVPPAGKVPPAVLHTMLRAEVDIVHDDAVTPTDPAAAVKSVPAGASLREK